MRQFCGFGDKGHHDQIRANDGDVLKPEAQEMRPGRPLIQRINQVRRPLSHADFLHLGPHLGYSSYGATEDIKF